mmetsp:Transcript_14271/g.13780  ORF Transcript_14271/g.13780 Transcript_14271/m.13780 type:complete len:130 (+) Transcript_14271:1075-1464(+)
MEATIGRFQLNYLGHILRMKETRYPIIMLHAEIALGKKSVGFQETTYRHSIKNTLRNFEALKNLAQNRAFKRKVVRDACTIIQGINCIWANLLKIGTALMIHISNNIMIATETITIIEILKFHLKFQEN